MSHTLPDKSQEEWRYADITALERLPDGALDRCSEIEVAAGETFRKLLILDGNMADITKLKINLGEGSRAEIFAVISSSDYNRLEITIDLKSSSHFEFGGVTIGGGEITREFVTRTGHIAPGATSNQVVRAVHWGKATGNFLGRIDVARAGQQTDAAQDFKALLLERGASANAKPELEIFADDVKCAHGATVGELDEMARYYMASRGLAPDVAKRLLIRAFIADAFVALDDEAERERMLDAALAELEKQG